MGTSQAYAAAADHGDCPCGRPVLGSYRGDMLAERPDTRGESGTLGAPWTSPSRYGAMVGLTPSGNRVGSPNPARWPDQRIPACSMNTQLRPHDSVLAPRWYDRLARGVSMRTANSRSRQSPPVRSTRRDTQLAARSMASNASAIRSPTRWAT
jgi:hypothetical protein